MDFKLNEIHLIFLETAKEQEQSLSLTFWSKQHPGMKEGFTLPQMSEMCIDDHVAPSALLWQGELPGRREIYSHYQLPNISH